MAGNISGGGVSGREFRDFKAEMSDFKAETRGFQIRTEERLGRLERKIDAMLELLQAHVTGTAERFDALEGRLEQGVSA